MNVSIEQLIIYEEQKKKQQQEELGRQREYAQVSYDITHEDKPCDVEDDQQKCQVLITSL